MAYGTGIDIYVIKTASWCNLNCSYCYYFNGADDSYQSRPNTISMAVITATTDQIVAHCAEHRLSSILIDFHGGEPLLQPKAEFEAMVREFDRVRDHGITPRYKVTTNATLIDEEWIEIFLAHDVLVGVSIDGPKQIHDEFRVDHAGRGSYDRVMRGVEKLSAASERGLNFGAISVVNPGIGGDVTYQHLRRLGISNIQILLPEATHDRPPVLRDGSYGRFLGEVYDSWIAEDDPAVNVGLLANMVQALAGMEPQTDQFGHGPVRVAVVETDGSIEPTDNFKICENRMTDLGLSVLAGNTFNDLYYHEFFEVSRREALRLPQECLACEYRDACNGGRISHRYSAGGNFDNPSVYCADLKSAFGHIQQSMSSLEFI